MRLLPFRKRHLGNPEQREKRIIEMYQGGATYREIGENSRTIRKVLLAHGIKPCNRHEAVKKQWAGEKGKARRANSKRKYRILTVDGYYAVLFPGKHRSLDRGRVKEHMLIAEDKIGRRLRRGEVVHHVNCNKLDNRPENLQVMTAAKHNALHMGMVKRDKKNGRIKTFKHLTRKKSSLF